MGNVLPGGFDVRPQLQVQVSVLIYPTRSVSCIYREKFKFQMEESHISLLTRLAKRQLVGEAINRYQLGLACQG